MNELFILMGADAPVNVCWAERRASGMVSVGQCGLAEVAAKVKPPYRTVVLVPGVDVFLTEVQRPGGNLKRALAAIPYAMEDDLAADIDSIHFALGESKTRQVPVAAVARQRMLDWHNMLQDAGMEADVLAPATLALPRHDGCRTVLAAVDEVLVGAGKWGGYGVDPANLLSLLKLGGPGAPIVFYQCGEHEFDFTSLAVEVDKRDPPQGNGCERVLTLLASSYTESGVINLLQGAFSRHAEWGKVWRKWRAVLLLLLACLALVTASFAIDYINLAHGNRELTRRIRAVYRQTFPGAKRIVNVRAQMEQKLALLKAGGDKGRDFLDILDTAGPVLLATKGFKLQGMRYLAGRLDLELSIGDLQVLDDLKNRLVAVGLAVEIKAATSEAGRVQARIQLRSAS